MTDQPQGMPSLQEWVQILQGMSYADLLQISRDDPFIALPAEYKNAYRQVLDEVGRREGAPPAMDIGLPPPTPIGGAGSDEAAGALLGEKTGSPPIDWDAYGTTQRSKTPVRSQNFAQEGQVAPAQPQVQFAPIERANVFAQELQRQLDMAGSTLPLDVVIKLIAEEPENAAHVLAAQGVTPPNSHLDGSPVEPVPVPLTDPNGNPYDSGNPTLARGNFWDWLLGNDPVRKERQRISIVEANRPPQGTEARSVDELWQTLTPGSPAPDPAGEWSMIPQQVGNTPVRPPVPVGQTVAPTIKELTSPPPELRKAGDPTQAPGVETTDWASILSGIVPPETPYVPPPPAVSPPAPARLPTDALSAAMLNSMSRTQAQALLSQLLV